MTRATTVLAILALVATSVAASTAAAQNEPLAVFDYWMPDRYGLDDNGDGLIDSFVPLVRCTDATTCVDVGPTSPLDPTPDRWSVVLDGCESEAIGTGHTYGWRFLDEPDVEITTLPSGCEFEASVPAEGTYRVELTVNSSEGTAVTTQEVVVQDWLIVSMGDSYGSGEGNPDVEQGFADDDGELLISPAEWSDRRCHRSAHAGSARAALALETLDPRTSVTFIHVACSGATIARGDVPDVAPGGGLTDTYHGIESPEREASVAGTIEPLPPQVEQVAALIGDREVDVAYMSVGGNDALFGPVVSSCLVLDPCNPVAQGLEDGVYPDAGLVVGTCTVVTVLTILVVGVPALLASPFLATACAAALLALIDDFAKETAEHWFQAGLVGDGDLGDPASLRLSQRYGLADAALSGGSSLQIPAGRADRVFISEYVDATRNDDGSYCPSGDVVRDLALPGGTADEFSWIDETFEQKLTELVGFNADRFGWTLVDGIYDSFQDHGVCASDTWMRGLFESIVLQGDYTGTAHPNRAGHLVYRNRILERWLPALYPDADQSATPGFPNGRLPEPFVTSLVRTWIDDHDPRRPDQAPVADAGGPYSVAEGSAVTAVNGSFDANGDALSHAWSSSDAGVATVAPADAETPSISGIDDGVASLTLTVDADDGSDIDSTPVTVLNVAPAVTAPATFSGPEGSLALTLGIADPGTADTHTLAVDWDDGTTDGPSPTATGAVEITHTYADDGAYTVTIDVADDDGGSDTAMVGVALENVAPTVSVDAPAGPLREGEVVALGATYVDPGRADTHSASIDWGDGISESITTIPGIPATGSAGSLGADHVYADDGTYTVEVCVLDDDGGEGCTATVLDIDNQAPAVEITSLADDLDFVLPLIPVSVHGSFNDPGTLDTHTAAIDWGDGSVSPATVSETPTGPPGNTAGTDGTYEAGPHTYATSGTMVVAVSVVDDEGGAGSAGRTLEVLDPATATGRLIDDLAEAAADPGTPPDAAADIDDALWHLSSPNGALARIGSGDLAAAVRKLELASAALDDALIAGAPEPVAAAQLLLALVGRSLAAEALAAAIDALDPTAPGDRRLRSTLESAFAAGVALHDDGSFTPALGEFHVVTRRATQVTG